MFQRNITCRSTQAQEVNTEGEKKESGSKKSSEVVGKRRKLEKQKRARKAVLFKPRKNSASIDLETLLLTGGKLKGGGKVWDQAIFTAGLQWTKENVFSRKGRLLPAGEKTGGPRLEGDYRNGTWGKEGKRL